ncbi:hypothetical protein K502DRAFT_352282 [Neoconidiobolus thromboides FSU 785]|nr:hypothetical protein K502DRAFT_352282 [Neoconidiobolus thromboides FSU 785]
MDGVTSVTVVHHPVLSYRSLGGYDGRWSVCVHGATDVETPCNGDSGGPLVANGNILVGTVSYGNACRSYSVFARVSYLKSFIQQYL